MKPNLLKKSHQGGFTLIELIVVMLLAALAAGMVFINVGQASRDQDGRVFARELHRLARTARLQALSTGAIRVLSISSEERRCWIDDQNSLDIPEQIRIQGKHLARSNDTQHAVYFFPDGSASGGILTISENEQVLLRFHVDILTGLVVVDAE